jgi:hypothetical protein
LPEPFLVLDDDVHSPSDGSIVQVAETAGLTVVGSGVSTCAPER